MSNLTSRSEALLAEGSIRRHGDAEVSVLIVGPGMGFTLRAALDLLGPKARVTVSTFLNRLVALTIKMQSILFTAFDHRHTSRLKPR